MTVDREPGVPITSSRCKLGRRWEVRSTVYHSRRSLGVRSVYKLSTVRVWRCQILHLIALKIKVFRLVMFCNVDVRVLQRRSNHNCYRNHYALQMSTASLIHNEILLNPKSTVARASAPRMAPYTQLTLDGQDIEPGLNVPSLSPRSPNH